MRLLSIVDDYVLAAIGRAQAQALEGDILEAWVPECPGVLASGANSHECIADLFVRLEAWVRVAAGSGEPLPVLDGIDLNTPDTRRLVEYHDFAAAGSVAEIYANPTELDAAFRARASRG